MRDSVYKSPAYQVISVPVEKSSPIHIIRTLLRRQKCGSYMTASKKMAIPCP